MIGDSARVNVFTLVYVIGADGRVLMMRRRGDRKILAGRLSAPGGKVEPGEDVLEAAVREVREETGLVAENPVYRGVYGYFTDAPGNPSGVIHLVEIRDFSGDVVVEGEEGEIGWYTREEIRGDITVTQDHQDMLDLVLQTRDCIGALALWRQGELVDWRHSGSFFEGRRLQA